MSKKTSIKIAIIAVLILAALAAAISLQPRITPSHPAAAPETDTLKKIKDSGTIVLGHRESSVPFSYYDDEKHVIGYSQDLAKRIAEAIKTELNIPKLDVKLVPVTPQNRFTLIQDGAIDLECGSTGNTSERQKMVAFSNSIFITRMQLMTRKDYGIRDFPDLAGKTVVTTAGTTNVAVIQKMNEEKKMGMNIIIANDHREAFLILEGKRADAFLMDDILLNGERTRAIRWGDWIITGTPQSREAYGCILRKNDPKFKKLVDRTLANIMTSGEGERIYTKWFMSPIPPNGINLNFPMSDDMVNLFKSPNDKAFE